MAFRILCPHCNKEITPSDFKANEQSLSHLQTFFNSQEKLYKQELTAKIEKQLVEKKNAELQAALSKKELEVSEIKQKEINKLLEQISNLNSIIKDNQRELVVKLTNKENELKEQHEQQIAKFREMTNEAENKLQTITSNHKQILDSALAKKELEVSESKQKEIDNLREKIAKLDSNSKLYAQELKLQLLNKENELKQQYEQQIESLKRESNESKMNLKAAIETHKRILEAELSKKHLEISEAKQQEISELKKKINILEAAYNNYQQDLKLKLLTKEKELINLYEPKVKELSQENINLKNSVENNQKILEAELSKKELEIVEQKQKEISDLKDKLNELNIKLEQGRNIRTGILGSNLENDFESKMPTFFPDDVFEKTTRPINGRKPDFKLEVINFDNNETITIGNILFELKNQEKFDNNWEDKLSIELKEWNARFGIIIWTNAKTPLMRGKKNRDIFIVNADLEVIVLIVNILKYLIQKEYNLLSISKNQAEREDFKFRFQKWLTEEFNILIGKATKEFENFDKKIESMSKINNDLQKIRQTLYTIFIEKIEVALKNI